MRQVVLITGLIGAGKSAVSHILELKGHEVIRMDDIAKSAIDNELNAVFNKTFGESLTSKARTLYFNPDYRYFREKFEAMLDEYLAMRIVHLLYYVDPDNKDPLFIEVPAMRYSRFKHFIEKFEKQIQKVILVTVNTEVRCERLVKRGLTVPQIIERTELQSEDIPVDEKLIVRVENDDSLEILAKRVEYLTEF